MDTRAVDNLSPSDKRCPSLIIMVGSPGSGKSHLGRILSEALGALLIQTDAVRKEVFPVPTYAPTEAAHVYGICHQRIAEGLAQGRCVVFDGTNLRERQRRTLYQLAERAGAPFFIVVATAPEAVIHARLRHRMEHRDADDQSDADWRVYRRMRQQAEPIPRPHIVANTAAAPGPVVRLLKHHLGG